MDMVETSLSLSRMHALDSTEEGAESSGLHEDMTYSQV